MRKAKHLRFLTSLVIISLLIATQLTSVHGMISQNSTNWFWISDTNASSVTVGDVNGDGVNEVITAGYYNNGTNFIGQLLVWNASNLATEKAMVWLWNNDTNVAAVALANITGSQGLDIVTVGSYFNGTNWIAQMLIWNGTTLAPERVMVWLWGQSTYISSVAIGNLTKGSSLDIVTGGGYFDGTKWIGQVLLWNASTLAVEGVNVWVWGQNTEVNSVAVGNITGGANLDVVTAGEYFDGTSWIGQLAVWNGLNLAFEKVGVWLWGQGTFANAVAVANITGGNTMDIISGGSYLNGVNSVGQILVWNGTSMAVEKGAIPLYGQTTEILSVAVGNFTNGPNLDIVGAGRFNDGFRSNALLIDYNSAAMQINSLSSWFITSDTSANSVAIGNTGFGNRLITVGQYWDNTRSNAQLIIWA